VTSLSLPRIVFTTIYCQGWVIQKLQTEPSGVAEATFCVNVSELVWLLFMIGVRDLLAIVPSNHLPFPEFSKGENAFSSPQQTRLLHLQPRFPIPFVVDLDIKLV
jgi:hypothetical protein